jgi:hypothetical protein
MHAVMERREVISKRVAELSIDPAELLFSEIMAQPVTRSLDRALGIEGTPAGFQNPEASFQLSYAEYFIGGWEAQ